MCDTPSAAVFPGVSQALLRTYANCKKEKKIFCQTAHHDAVLVWVYASAHGGQVAFIAVLFICLYSACTHAAANIHSQGLSAKQGPVKSLIQ